MNNINIILPTDNNLLKISKSFVRLKNSNPDFFNNYILNLSLLGCFPYCIWSLSEQEKSYHSKEDIEYFYEFCLNNNASIYFEFSNTKLKKEHFYDNYTNLFLSLAKEGNFNVITENKELKKFIEEKYENINTNTENVLYLNSYCENCKKCHDKRSENKLNFERSLEINCKNKITSFEESQKLKTFISLEKIIELNEIGYKDFIISAQNKDNYEFIESCLYYLIKNEYKNQVRLQILKENSQFLI